MINRVGKIADSDLAGKVFWEVGGTLPPSHPPAFSSWELPATSRLSWQLKYHLYLRCVIQFLEEGGCDFDVDFCNWTNDASGDDFDWIRLNEKTPSSNTGPTEDRSGLGT